MLYRNPLHPVLTAGFLISLGLWSSTYASEEQKQSSREEIIKELRNSPEVMGTRRLLWVSDIDTVRSNDKNLLKMRASKRSVAQAPIEEHSKQYEELVSEARTLFKDATYVRCNNLADKALEIWALRTPPTPTTKTITQQDIDTLNTAYMKQRSECVRALKASIR